jgi:hypothetical protein
MGAWRSCGDLLNVIIWKCEDAMMGAFYGAMANLEIWKGGDWTYYGAESLTNLKI